MREEFLGEWVFNLQKFIRYLSYLKEYTELRVKTSLLLGRQSLKNYKGWKGDEDDIQREHKMNHQVGLEFNAWRGGVLVNDDDGKVLQKLEELQNNNDNVDKKRKVDKLN